jgi:hypothetical protein
VTFTLRPTTVPGRFPVTIRTGMISGPEQPDRTPADNVVTVDLNIAA